MRERVFNRQDAKDAEGFKILETFSEPWRIGG